MAQSCEPLIASVEVALIWPAATLVMVRSAPRAADANGRGWIGAGEVVGGAGDRGIGGLDHRLGGRVGAERRR